MRSIAIITACCLILPFYSEAEKVKGKIFFENDTIEVMIHVPVNSFTDEPNLEKLQFKVVYYDSTGQKIKLRPDHARGFSFTYGTHKILMLSVYNSLELGVFDPTGNNIFLHQIIDGKLKMFIYYNTAYYPLPNTLTGTLGIYHYQTDRCILQKGDGELKRTRTSGFKKDMAEYFSDCPELVEKIMNTEYDEIDMKSIVDFYNLFCWPQ